MRKISFLLLLLSLIISTSAHSSSSSFTGRVIKVHDGGTITVFKQNNEKVQIRLAGIDCPETSQVHGDAAKQFVLTKVSGRRVRIETETTDRYGRTVAIVLVNGENVNKQIVAHGNHDKPSTDRYSHR